MPEVSAGSGEALDAEVSVDPVSSARHQEYLDAVADEAEAAVKNVEAQIAHLQESLKDRRAQAKEARAAARTARKG